LGTGTFEIGFSGTVIVDETGSHVSGTFTVKDLLGNFNVDANCLEVAPVAGGRVAGATGRVVASTDPSQPKGSGIAVQAFDSTNPVVPDGLTIIGLPEAPGPNECFTPTNPLSSITEGKITIRL
jgi:hypothetical protein